MLLLVLPLWCACVSVVLVCLFGFGFVCGFLVSFACLFLFSFFGLFSGRAGNNVEVKICNSVTSEYFANFQINFDPYPIPMFKPGAKVTTSYSLDLLKPLEVGFTVSLEASMVLGPLGSVPFPCVCIDCYLR